MARALSRAREVGNQRAESLCSHAMGAVEYLLGEWGESERAFERSITLAREVDATFGVVLGEQRLALLETGLGRFDEGLQRLLRALATARSSSNLMVQVHSFTRIFGTLCTNRLDAGDLGEARNYLEEGFAVQEERGECVPCDALLYPAAVPIYLGLGEMDRAEWACAKAEDTARTFASRAWTAMVVYLRGLMLSESGDRERASACLKRAVDEFEALEQPFDVARALESLAGVVSHSDGSPSSEARAVECLEQAGRIYGHLGARPHLERVQGQLDLLR